MEWKLWRRTLHFEPRADLCELHLFRWNFHEDVMTTDAQVSHSRSTYGEEKSELRQNKTKRTGTR